MKLDTFADYLRDIYPAKSGTRASYLKAIKIIDDIFAIEDVFHLNSQSLTEIKDPVLIDRIIDFIADEEDKFRHQSESIFDLGQSNQTSYPKKRFCTGAIRQLGTYINLCCAKNATKIMEESSLSGQKLSAQLLRINHIEENGTEKEIRAKHRVGQEIFRAILLKIYNSRCCLTGIDVPEVLRASHIKPWADSKKKDRLNPENGLCLSATYDAAFDRHLISFDGEYRLILSPVLKEQYTSDAFKTHFLKFEGHSIELPSKYLPSQIYLASHREALVS